MDVKQVLINKKIEPSCSYCKYGNKISDEEVACIKKGVVSSGYYCRKFKYDPLRREPPIYNLIDTKELKEEDFEL